MQISDLLTLMGTLSVGSDNVTSSERALFLRYLNLAHFQLYQETAPWNEELLVTETLTNPLGSTVISLSHFPFAMNSVYDLTQRRALPRRALRDILEQDPLLSFSGSPRHYFLQQNFLHLYPTQTAVREVSVWYTPNPNALTESTEESAIPYPVAFHPVLVDGALYYLFQQEGGFKNTQKETEARERWQTGKTRLLSYLYSNSAQRLSTFSNV